jgi:hypothetical protein
MRHPPSWLNHHKKCSLMYHLYLNRQAKNAVSRLMYRPQALLLISKHWRFLFCPFSIRPGKHWVNFLLLFGWTFPEHWVTISVHFCFFTAVFLKFETKSVCWVLWMYPKTLSGHFQYFVVCVQLCFWSSKKQNLPVGTFLTYATHIVYDVHHRMQHTPFIVYIVQDCRTTGWQVGRVLTSYLSGSVHDMVQTQHWCLFAPTFWLWPAPPHDLHAFIKSRQRDKNGETTTVADYGGEQVNWEQTMGAGHKGIWKKIIMAHRMVQAGALWSDVTTTVA